MADEGQHLAADVKIAAARREARVSCTETDPLEREIAAFDITVEGMGQIGRWAQLHDGGGMVAWSDGSHAETDDCEGDPIRVAAAVRASIPIRTEFEERPESERRLRLLPGLDG